MRVRIVVRVRVWVRVRVREDHAPSMADRFMS